MRQLPLFSEQVVLSLEVCHKESKGIQCVGRVRVDPRPCAHLDSAPGPLPTGVHVSSREHPGARQGWVGPGHGERQREQRPGTTFRLSVPFYDFVVVVITFSFEFGNKIQNVQMKQDED